MKKLWISLIGLIVLAVIVFSVQGQVVVGGPGAGVIIQTGSGAPSGNCTGINYLYLNTANGDTYSCPNPNSTWVKISGGGGGLPAGLTFVAPTLTVSTAGSGNGQLALSGNTSGTATLTAPAVAGTTSNPVVSSNALQLPSLGQSVAGLNWAGGAGFLVNDNTNHFLLWGSTAQDWFGLKNSGPGAVLNGTGCLAWVPGNNIGSGVVDIGVCRLAPDVMQFGNGTFGDESALPRWNVCRVTADVSLTVNVANSFCSFSLPAVAKAWAWSCDIQWAITAGTGTNNFAVGVNASQTPTGTTNGEAQVYTATTGTQTMASAAVSASGATNLLTGATYTPAATVEFAHTSGTLLASGTAGTFAISGTANGTTATAAVKAGTVCWLN